MDYLGKDLVESIRDNYNSIRGTDDSNFTDTMNNEHTYGYNYYSQQATEIPNTINSDNHKVLNAIYDLRGTIGIIPVVGERPLIEIHILHVVQGNLEFELKDNVLNFNLYK